MLVSSLSVLALDPVMQLSLNGILLRVKLHPGDGLLPKTVGSFGVTTFIGFVTARPFNKF